MLRMAVVTLLMLSACHLVGPEEEKRAPLPWHTLAISGPLQYTASAAWAGRHQDDSIHATLEMHNPGTDTVLVQTGPCGFGLRAYRTADLAEPAAWDDRPPPRFVCPDLGLEYRIAPGESEVVEVHELGLGEYTRLPRPGLYYFAVIIKDEQNQLHRIPAGAVVVR